ncbi:MAG: heptaprenyl diphosphate synthase component 1 [Sporolactobacillus sp.]|nr:heptaprenyl diphosphate synthase component 1 [Sporolactobacillus sp.]MCI1883165.1 heptaprenyl diphosphate synthase component 1 [Sporolactobacillus sp.]
MSLKEETESIYRRMMNDLYHPYVKKVLREPVVDRDKLCLYYLLFRTKAAPETAAAYTESVMVAEIGLSTHEAMTTKTLSERESIKKRQLITLSGDFYSALYYYSLARNRNIKIVRWIAEAIQFFNEEKFRLFYPTRALDWSETVQAVGAIECALIAQIAEKLGMRHIVPALNDFFLTKKLAAASESSGENGLRLLFRLIHPKTLRSNIDREISRTIRRFDLRCAAGKNENRLLAPLFDYMSGKMHSYRQCFAEEG